MNWKTQPEKDTAVDEKFITHYQVYLIGPSGNAG